MSNHKVKVWQYHKRSAPFFLLYRLLARKANVSNVVFLFVEKTIGEVAQEFTRKTMVVIALTVLTSSQGLLIAVSNQGGKFEYSVMSANCMVEVTKCVISLLFLMRQWNTTGVTEDNTLRTTLHEVWVYPVPALLYLIKVSTLCTCFSHAFAF